MADSAEVHPDTKMLPEIVRGVPAGLELGLRNYWYPIVQSHELPAESPVGITCLGEDLALYRDSKGSPKVLFDRCPHRYVKLSVGRVLGDELQCILHGLRFDGTGACTLIPWEQPMEQAIRQKLCVQSYKAAEVGGIVWAYLGDEKQFPAPPIEHSLPEELFQPDRFVHFLLPTEIWDANWLLVLDGGDSYHAVTLHIESQQHDAVLEYLDKDTVSQLADRKEQTPPKSVPPLADRRVRIVETDGHGLRGMSVDLEGNHLDHGHELTSLKGERFNLPVLITNALRPVHNAAPYVSRFFQVPVNYNQTRVFRYAAWRAEGQEERDRLKQHFEAIVKPRQLKTSAEDGMMASVAGDLVESRKNELLLAPDRDMMRLRRRIVAAFTSQKLSGRRAPEDEMTPSPETLAFPV
jgi:phenylpropionate dioxygenase-like ring-hydroxylating dioxygenase large terminal subunit